MDLKPSKKNQLLVLIITIIMLFGPTRLVVATSLESGIPILPVQEVTGHAALLTNISPVAAFANIPDDPVAGEWVQFVDFSTDADGQIVGWDWDFGDGGTNLEKEPLHYYARPGSYTVTLTVTDDGGAQGAYQKVIPVTRGSDILVIQIAAGIVCVAGLVVAYRVGRKEKRSN